MTVSELAIDKCRFWKSYPAPGKHGSADFFEVAQWVLRIDQRPRARPSKSRLNRCNLPGNRRILRSKNDTLKKKTIH